MINTMKRFLLLLFFTPLHTMNLSQPSSTSLVQELQSLSTRFTTFTTQVNTRLDQLDIRLAHLEAQPLLKQELSNAPVELFDQAKKAKPRIAKKLYKKLLTHTSVPGPLLAATQLELARIYQNQKKWKRAARIAKPMMQEHPDNQIVRCEAHVIRGVACYHLEKYRSAHNALYRFYNRDLKGESSIERIAFEYFGHTMLHDSSEGLHDILRCFLKASSYANAQVPVQDHKAYYFNLRGNAYLKFNNFKKAIKNYTHALDRNPNLKLKAHALYHRALANNQNGNTLAAIQDFDNFLKNPTSKKKIQIDTLITLGALSHTPDKKEAARTYWNRALSLSLSSKNYGRAALAESNINALSINGLITTASCSEYLIGPEETVYDE